MKLNKLLFFICLFNLNFNLSAQSIYQSAADKDVNRWVESYLNDKQNFSNIENVLHHIFLIQKCKSVSIYTFGKNVEPGLDFLLIKKKDKTYVLLGSKKNSTSDLIFLYNFFEQNTIFSEKTKIRCYENIIQRIILQKEEVVN